MNIGFPKPSKVKIKKVIVKSIAQLKKTTQREVNAYIRLRDKDEMCISCGKQCGTWQAGHFWSQGSNGALRYNFDNIHKQGNACNTFLHGNLLNYRLNLVKKIGVKKVEWLDEHHHDVKKWTREELEEIRSNVKSLQKELNSTT